MCSQHPSALHSMNDSLNQKMHITDFPNVSALQNLLTCKRHVSVD